MFYCYAYREVVSEIALCLLFFGRGIRIRRIFFCVFRGRSSGFFHRSRCWRFLRNISFCGSCWSGRCWVRRSLLLIWTVRLPIMLFLSIRIFVLVERLSLTIQKINACNKNEGSNDNLRKAVTEIVYYTCKRSWKKPVKYVGNASPENADSKKNQKSCCNCVMFFEKSRYVSCKLVKMKHVIVFDGIKFFIRKRFQVVHIVKAVKPDDGCEPDDKVEPCKHTESEQGENCLLYTSDAADD